MMQTLRGIIKTGLISLSLLTLAALPAQAQTVTPGNVVGYNTVTSLADSGPGSLRQAIDMAPLSNHHVIYFTTNGTITLTSGELVITNDLAILGNGATNTVISGNNSSRVLTIQANTTVSITGLTIQEGSAPKGIDAIVDHPNYQDLTQAGNGEDGGGILNHGALTLTHCILLENQAGMGGSSGYSVAGSGGHGGAVYNTGRLNVTDCTVQTNSAGKAGSCTDAYYPGDGGHGGGIFSSGTLIISNSTVCSNQAAPGGGAAGHYYGGAAGSGGGVYNRGKLTVTNSDFMDNVSGKGGVSKKGGSGGAIYTMGTEAVILKRSSFAHNTTGDGGNSYADFGLNGGNGGDGGGVYSQSPLQVDACTFSSNITGKGERGWTNDMAGNGSNGGHGGGLYNGASLSMTNCTFYLNETGIGGLGGDGEYGRNGDPGVQGSGGAVYNSNSVSMISCTLHANTAYMGGGICSDTNAPTASLHNCLIADNTATFRGVDVSGAFSSLSHNLIGIGSGSTGLTNGVNHDLVGGFSTAPINPQLIVNGSSGVPELAPGSPAIDQGDDALAGGVDQLDAPRKQGRHVDIGAQESEFWSVHITSNMGPSDRLLAISYPDNSNTVVSAKAAQAHWTFSRWSDGNTNLTRTLTAPLTSESYTAIYTEQPGALTFHVATNGMDSADGLSWNSPFKTIQAAIDWALDSDTVLVSNGVYNTSAQRAGTGGATYNRVILNKDIRVASVHGPDVTTIVGDKELLAPVRGVFITDGTLSGFSITNGFTKGQEGPDGKGGAVYAEEGTLTNCLLRSNSANLGGGAYGGNLTHCMLNENSANDGGGAYNSTLENCAVTANKATHGGGAYNSILTLCTVTTNNATYGGGTYESTLDNCLVNSNIAAAIYVASGIYYGGGGGAYGGHLQNCVITENSSPEGGATYESTMINCTAANNHSYYVRPICKSTLNNCIVWNNQGGTTADATLSYCCTTPLPSGGVGNIDLDPQFVDAANGDFRLKPSSPCINSGDNSVATNGVTDLDGNSRIVGSAVDMGAYEYQPAPGFESWAIQRAGNQLVPDQTDINGIPSLLKYATGQTDLRAKSRGTVTNGQFAMKFYRNPNAADVTMVLESKASLTNATWTGVATNMNGTGWNSPLITESGTGSPISVEFRPPAPAATNQFLRLRVVKP